METIRTRAPHAWTSSSVNVLTGLGKTLKAGGLFQAEQEEEPSPTNHQVAKAEDGAAVSESPGAFRCQALAWLLWVDEEENGVRTHPESPWWKGSCTQSHLVPQLHAIPSLLIPLHNGRNQTNFVLVAN